MGREIPTSHYAATGVKCVTFILAIILLQIQRLKGEITSGVLFLFWVLQIFGAVLPLYSKLTNQASCTESIVYFVYFLILSAEFILHCFTEKYGQLDRQEFGKQPCPEGYSSVLSQFTFWWLTPLIVKAYRKTLGADDMWDQTPKLKSKIVAPELEAAWKEEVKLCQRRNDAVLYRNCSLETNSADEKTPLLNGSVPQSDIVFENKPRSWRAKRPSLYKVFFKTYVFMWLQSAGFKVVSDGFWFLQPFAIRQIISLIEGKDSENHPKWQGYALSASLLFAGFGTTLFFHKTYHKVMTLGLRAKTSLINLIYKKSLTMTQASKKSTAVGDIVNLMSVDCQRIQDSFTYSYYIITFTDLLVLGMIQLFDLMGVAAVGTLSVTLVLAPAMIILGGLQQKQHRQILSLKGKRINLLNEILGGIKVLKMYTWEKSFEDKVQALRLGEQKCLHKLATLNSLSILFAIHSPFLMMYFSILIYVFVSPNHFIDAQKVFTALSIVNILRYTVSLVPFLINGVIQGYVSIGRIQKFLWNEDLDPNTVDYVSKSDFAVEVDNGIFTWDRDLHRHTLQEINLKVKEGQLIAIVGQVGSGKSSIISSLLGEMEKVQGRVTIKGSLAYVPQEAWIQNLTLRDNILYGKNFMEKKYRRVLESCALLPDLQILDGGDMTEIGEKGINISGGQKQRVSLARAVYSNSDIYLMDDPLSAVDSHVGKDLFRNVIGREGLLRHKTRILVTHGVHWLPMVDRIVVLTDGRISEIGSYEELLNHNGAFAQFLQEYLIQDKSSDEEDPEIEQIKDKMWQKVEYVTSEGVTSDDNQDTTSVRKRRRQRRMSTRDSINRSSSKESGNQTTQLVKQNSNISRLIEEETAQIGTVSIDVFIAFTRAMGFLTVVAVYVFMGTFQGLNIFSNYWLTFWTEDPYLKNQTLSNTTLYKDKFVKYVVVYTVLGVTQGTFLFLFAYVGLNSMVRASGYLHKSMLTKILRSPMSFFDTTPIGRIMNRFSSDIDIMDINLPMTFRLWMIMTFNLLSTIIVISVNTPIFLAVVLPIGIIYILMLRFYLPTARQVKRMESVTRSPIYNHFSETISGASVIRAFRSVDRFIDESRHRVDKNCTFFFAANTAARWISVRLESLGTILIFVASIFAIISPNLNGAQVGMSVTYGMLITWAMNLVVQAVSEMEMNIVSAERVKEYTELPSEAEWKNLEHRPPVRWPQTGQVQFKSYTTRYRPGLDLVLHGIDCIINSGEKVGIVGRTGAGKSSLTLSLFRLIEAAGGQILIDGVNVADMGLHDLRSKITILPQDPVIFSGSLRMNLDPFGHFGDEELWQALRCAHLSSFVNDQPHRLNYECGEGGQNLSVGQRQLICLARTLLHKTRILILDEATAAVDMETDDLIQQTIQSEFKDCTILTIAHRLKTIMDYDRVMVLDKGLIVEFDKPETLLQDQAGVFYGMAKDANLL